MDPNEALKVITTIARRVVDTDVDLDTDYPSNDAEHDDLVELASAVLNLDEWLSKGGFLPDAWVGCDVCLGSGYLLDQSYGQTVPPSGGRTVQRCDQCGCFGSDVEAAEAAATALGDDFLVIALGDEESHELAPSSDVFIVKSSRLRDTHVQWVTTEAAMALGWYLP